MHSIFPVANFQCPKLFGLASFQCTIFFRVAIFQCTVSTRISSFLLDLQGKDTSDLDKNHVSELRKVSCFTYKKLTDHERIPKI